MRFQLRIVVLAVLVTCSVLALRSEAAETKALTMVVMDPLAAPLSCPCVEGYAQRKYEHLEAFLEAKLDRSINLLFVESLESLKQEDLAGGTIDLIIGKDSVVRFDAKTRDLRVTPLGRLTDKDGSTTQFGMIVVGRDDPAQKPADLQGYQIYFGASEAEEKHQAAIELLNDAGVKLPNTLQISQACSDGACKILELKDDAKGAAVISSYAAPLLEGCGTIKKGDLRVIGKTKMVPFITAFATHHVGPNEKKELKQALMDVLTEPELCAQLETLIGFVPLDTKDSSVKKK
ncbi:PhnD/SsuA/transferrin family substrate-binding protein [Bremerella sp. P1]|uniref:PhnD/SsuA/transferrin family substrate-binding protein n=1 Tax=Bremerella sp. P1 TaxID=3026424 RepID=UPI002368A061|nr:PhnD/SsuA/transferrin family substrate-binding protein [Bremerella sp. P1]WDI45099.1 PhnD/SsuA/transferrin family substrate-binding protein [Bremerella sp. P1]